MPQPVRANRIHALKDELDKKDGQLVEVRGALMRILLLQNQNDDLAYQVQQHRNALEQAHDQNRQVITLFLNRHGYNDGKTVGAEFSQDELERAYCCAPQLTTVDDDAPGQRFRLDLSLPVRELKRPAPPADKPADTPAPSGTAEGSDQGSAPDDPAAPATKPDGSEPLPS
jgi:hypothetical protein